MYKIKLCTNPFDNTYKNVRLYDTKQERNLAFEAFAGETMESVNFNVGNGINTSIVFNCSSNVPLITILNYNYCVVTNEEQPETFPMFFWITGSSQLSDSQISCQLECDVFQTYFYDLDFSPCMINRAHLDRWVKDKNPKYSSFYRFNFEPSSPLFERENIEPNSTRIVARYTMNISPVTDNFNPTDNYLNLCKFISQNVICWIYVYLAENHKFKIYNNNGSENEENFPPLIINKVNNNNFKYNRHYSCICFPLLKSGCYIYGKYSTNTPAEKSQIDFNSFNSFITKNGWGNIYNIKLSNKIPFPLSTLDQTIKYNINDGFNILNLEMAPSYYPWNISAIYGYDLSSSANLNNIGVGLYRSAIISRTSNLVSSRGLLAVLDDYTFPTNYVLNYLENDEPDGYLPQLRFLSSDIKNNKNNYKMNPKLLSENFQNYEINFVDQKYNISIDKYNNSNIKLSLIELLDISLTTGILRLEYFTGEQNKNNYLNEYFFKSLNGLVYKNNSAVETLNNTFDSYVANNKNFYQQFQASQGLAKTLNNLKADANIVNGLIGGIGNFPNAAGMGASILGGLANGAVQRESVDLTLENNQKQFNFQIDNMKNAPGSINPGSDSLFLSPILYQASTPILYYNKAIESEMIACNQVMLEEGYSYNRIDNIKNHLKTRKYFNYINANLENITGQVSQNIKNVIKGIFASGIRLWHVDNINFEDENYEIYLDEEGEKNAEE